MDIKKTRNVVQKGIKILVHAEAGTGKTRLIATLPDPLVVDAEKGLLSIADMDIDYVEGKTFDDVGQAATLAMQNGKKSLAIDSFSEICENEIAVLLEQNPKDTWKAYGDLMKKTKALLLFLRDQTEGLNVYLICKTEREKDENGRLVYSPSLPGKATAQNIPYIFDEVFFLSKFTREDGTVGRAILTDNNGSCVAKDRSGKLDLWEQPDLGAIIRKIKGEPA